MKTDLQSAVILMISIALIPCIALKNVRRPNGEDFTVGVYFTAESKLETYPLEDYLVGAVLAQMPADFDEEALKAQAVLARTYIEKRRRCEESNPAAALHGALISDDERLYQSFFTEEQAKEFYGDEYEKARMRVREAVRSAPGILYYKGEPITPAYHSASSGMTASALDAWGQDIPYLQAAESPDDTKLDGAETEAALSADEFARTVRSQFGISAGAVSAEDIVTETNGSGYVTSLEICENKVNVQEFVSALGIASPCFTFEEKSGEIIFTARGFGHMVGMSQYGANAMAEKGSTYREILAHYFKDCELR